MSLSDVKPLLASRTVWSAILVLLSSALGLIGYQLEPHDQGEILAIGGQLGAMLGGLLSIVFRVRATKKIEPPTGGTIRLLAIGSLLVLAAIAGGCSAPGGYVAADRLTYAAIAPEYAAYVAADPMLDAEQRDRRMATVESWGRRIEAANVTRDGVMREGGTR